MIGTSLGPYRIIEQLGAGGMGEVWLAEDTRLGRKVAVKVLPEGFAADPERLARFEQEAKAAAALNHPHIAVVHDVGADGDVHYMVQEYLEGDTLRTRIDRGALPLDAALDLAGEVAAALAAAHKAGIVHRDLKPDNVFVTAEGHAKVLDFGLAKLTEVAAPTGASASMSPTVLGTVAGQIMGTAGYMAPEQVNGEAVDARADLFAFGCVLYEMVTGQRAFQGKNLHDTLSRIISEPPQPLHQARTGLPLKLGWMVDKALAKDPRRRYQTAGDLSADIEQLRDDLRAGMADASTAPREGEAAVAPARGIPWKVAAPAAVALMAVAALVALYLSAPAPAPPPPVQRFVVDLPSGTFYTNVNNRILAISPDARYVAWAARVPDASGPFLEKLGLRPMNGLEMQPLANAIDPRGPVFSPGGDQIAYYADAEDEIQRMPLAGQVPVTVTPLEVAPFGLSWADDGYLYFGRGEQGIWRVAEGGGQPEPVVALQPGESAHGPTLLPGGDWLLFTLRPAGAASWSDADIVAVSLADATRKQLVSGGQEGRVMPSGHLTYVSGGDLLAVPFDIEAVEVTGSPVAMVRDVGTVAEWDQSSGAAYYDVSRTGTLVYSPTLLGATRMRAVLEWISRAGVVEALPLEEAAYTEVRLSPDGRRLAAGVRADGQPDEPTQAIFVYRVDRAGGQRLSPPAGQASEPVWSPDGQWIYYAYAADGFREQIYRRRSDFSETAERVAVRPDGWPDRPELKPLDISSDGRWLLLSVLTRGEIETCGPDPGPRTSCLARFDLQDGGDLQPLFLDGGGESVLDGRFSPDGRFVVFARSDPGSGRQVVVGDIETGAMQLASARDGFSPRWVSDAEIVYLEFGQARRLQLVAVQIRTDPSIEIDAPGPPVPLTGGSYDIARDGERILVANFDRNATQEIRQDRMYFVLNWFEELKERVRPDGAR